MAGGAASGLLQAARCGNIRLLRFEPPEPSRKIGLAWRRSSPRKRDFAELGTMITELADAASPL
jgi:LysR family hydrogen peroxide-inducible transcriptional activator